MIFKLQAYRFFKTLMHKIFFIYFLIFFTAIAFAQETNLLQKDSVKEKVQVDDKIFEEIGKGIEEGDVTVISRYFGNQTFFSLANGVSGYYSSNQAFYVLEDFFKLYRSTSFRYDIVKTQSVSSYATGSYNYNFKGKRSSAKVYISLKKVGNNWLITQLTIN